MYLTLLFRCLLILGISFTQLATSKTRSFPKNFNWCVATSAHQIEGQNKDSDWWHFEQQSGKIKNQDKSGLACNHWNKLEEDTKILSDLGVNQYRFSIEWAKIEPKEGKWNDEAIKHYIDEINLLKKNGINPMITLQHFTLPKWLSDKGGWDNPEIITYFSKYTLKIVEYLGKQVSMWITVNEPLLVLAAGNVLGIMPPGYRDLKKLGESVRNMLLAHSRAYYILHDYAKNHKLNYQVGIAHNFTVFEANSSYNPLDLLMSNIVDQAINWTFLDAIETGVFKLYFPFHIDIDENLSEIKNTQDFIGLNYYTREYVKFTLNEPYVKRLSKKGKFGISDMNQEIYPEGILDVLNKINTKYPNKTFYITENGIADSNDKYRSKFLLMHLEKIHQALESGIDIKGYCHWSLMDNFEWMEGFYPRFGLYETDYKTLKRKARPSAKLFAKIIKNNHL